MTRTKINACFCYDMAETINNPCSCALNSSTLDPHFPSRKATIFAQIEFSFPVNHLIMKQMVEK
uniref:Mitotic-spindle organizing protein 1B-like n=1 Tax=Rhizophora mucronata TaxID=61149 RepID=A0A2P2II38_RHIMU